VIDVSLFLVILIQYSQRHGRINHCDRCITLLSDTDTVQSETWHDKSLIDVSLFLVILIQYSQRHSMINHCDRCITLSDTDTV
jgi:ribosomal protein L34E